MEDNIGGPAQQNSNGTTIGQLLAAGPQSVLTTAGQGEEPEGAAVFSVRAFGMPKVETSIAAEKGNDYFVFITQKLREQRTETVRLK